MTAPRAGGKLTRSLASDNTNINKPPGINKLRSFRHKRRWKFVAENVSASPSSFSVEESERNHKPVGVLYHDDRINTPREPQSGHEAVGANNIALPFKESRALAMENRRRAATASAPTRGARGFLGGDSPEERQRLVLTLDSRRNAAKHLVQANTTGDYRFCFINNLEGGYKTVHFTLSVFTPSQISLEDPEKVLMDELRRLYRQGRLYTNMGLLAKPSEVIFAHPEFFLTLTTTGPQRPNNGGGRGMGEVSVMFCMFLVIVHTREEDMLIIRRVNPPDKSFVDLLRRKLIANNMDYEHLNEPTPRANNDQPTPPDNPYHDDRHDDPHDNPHLNPHFNPYHPPDFKLPNNPGYASFHQETGLVVPLSNPEAPQSNYKPGPMTIRSGSAYPQVDAEDRPVYRVPRLFVDQSESKDLSLKTDAHHIPLKYPKTEDQDKFRAFRFQLTTRGPTYASSVTTAPTGALFPSKPYPEASEMQPRGKKPQEIEVHKSEDRSWEARTFEKLSRTRPSQELMFHGSVGEERQKQPGSLTKKGEDLEELLQQAMQRARLRRVRSQRRRSFGSYENASSPFRRARDYMRWKLANGLVLN